ncbi:MAG: alpha/beta fold hydrolase [Pseudomonadota bacterium]
MNGPPLIFAPGLMCDAALFRAQVGSLGPRHAVSHADLANDNTVAGMATRLLASAPARFCLAGLSMGGIVAFEVWRQAPDRVAGLVLMNTTPFADSPARQNVRQDQMARVRDGQLRTVVMEELKPNYLGAQTRDDTVLLEDIYAMANRLGPDVFYRQSEALMSRADSAQTLTMITCPTLIIAGDEDEVCPPDLHEIMHQAIGGSSLHVLSDCGHLSTLERPDRVTGLLTDFLSTL